MSVSPIPAEPDSEDSMKLTAPLHSPIRRIHPKKCSALLDAQRDRSLTVWACQLCSWRTCIEPPVAQAVQRQPADGRRRPHHRQAIFILAGLPGITRRAPVRGTWLRTVSLPCIIGLIRHGCGVRVAKNCLSLVRYYCLAILDKHHHPDITLGQGIKLLTMCTDELKRRLPIDFKGMVVKAVKADGIVDIEFDDDKVVKSA